MVNQTADQEMKMNYSTFPTIKRYTGAVLKMACEQHDLTREEFRLNTLKRVECDLGNLLEQPISELHSDERDVISDLHRQVRLAIGDE